MNGSGLKSYLAPTLLMLVASCQMAAVHFAGLTRWEGGGFGMYSELPPMTKHVVIDVSDGSKPLPVEELRELGQRKLVYQAMPSRKHLDRIAEILRRNSINSFRIEVWAERFDLADRTIYLERIGQVSENDRGDQ